MRRWALRILVFLLLGALVNVAVAWSIALWYEDHSARVSKNSPHEILQRAFGTQIVFNYMAMGFETEGRTVARWQAFGARSNPPQQHSVHGVVAGFPILALTGERLAVAGRTDGRWAIVLSHDTWTRLGAFGGSALPLRPVWPGFAINTLFYAVILWILFAVPFALRRRRRIKRGLCPKCAYDLRGSATGTNVCPECGATSQ